MGTPVFLFGATLGALLLCAGLFVGLVVGKQIRREKDHRPWNDDHINEMMSSLAAWTNGFASDVSEFRTVIEQVAQRMHSVETAPTQPVPAATGRFLTHLTEANDQLRKRLEEAELTLQQQAGEISAYMSEARTDSLTGLANRRAFDDALARRLAEWKRHGNMFAIVLIDIDRFKNFNDEYGHLAGDAVLAGVSHVMDRTLRDIDMLARFGGEEFAVILPNCDAQHACESAERLRIAVEQANFEYEQCRLQVTVSCGASQADDEVIAELIERADAALYSAKHAGRNRAFWHDGRQCWPIGGGPSCDTPPPSDDADDCAEQESREFAEVCADLRRKLDEVIW